MSRGKDDTPWKIMVISHLIEDCRRRELVNPLEEGCGKAERRERIRDCREKTGLIEDPGLASGHMGSLEGFGVEKCLAPDMILHSFCVTVSGDVNAKISCSLIRFQHLYRLLRLLLAGSNFYFLIR